MTSFHDLAWRCEPKKGEAFGGDRVIVSENEDGWSLVLLDAIGHGHRASEIADKVEGLINLYGSHNQTHVMQNIHENLLPEEQTVMLSARFDAISHKLTVASIGNTLAFVTGSETKQFVAKEGMVGGVFRKPALQTRILKEGDSFIAFSDGIQSRFYQQVDMLDVPHSARQYVNYLFEHYRKDYDDASCFVYQS